MKDQSCDHSFFNSRSHQLKLFGVVIFWLTPLMITASVHDPIACSSSTTAFSDNDLVINLERNTLFLYCLSVHLYKLISFLSIIIQKSRQVLREYPSILIIHLHSTSLPFISHTLLNLSII